MKIQKRAILFCVFLCSFSKKDILSESWQAVGNFVSRVECHLGDVAVFRSSQIICWDDKLTSCVGVSIIAP